MFHKNLVPQENNKSSIPELNKLMSQKSSTSRKLVSPENNKFMSQKFSMTRNK